MQRTQRVGCCRRDADNCDRDGRAPQAGRILGLNRVSPYHKHTRLRKEIWNMDMNSKTRSDAAWSGLSPEQRETLERWLFEDQLGYEEALERARSELGYAGSRTSLQRFYHRTATLRALRDVAMDMDGADAEEALRTGMGAIGKLFVRQVTENPEGIKDWAVLARLLLHNEENGLRRDFDGGRSDTWRGWLSLAREKFEFDAAE